MPFFIFKTPSKTFCSQSINRDNSDESPFKEIFSYYGNNPVALKDIHIHMYFFYVRLCWRPVAVAKVNFSIYKTCSKMWFSRYLILHINPIIRLSDFSTQSKYLLSKTVSRLKNEKGTFIVFGRSHRHRNHHPQPKTPTITSIFFHFQKL